MEYDNGLTIEQQFKIKQFECEVQKMPLTEIKERSVKLFADLMTK